MQSTTARDVEIVACVVHYFGAQTYADIVRRHRLVANDHFRKHMLNGGVWGRDVTGVRTLFPLEPLLGRMANMGFIAFDDSGEGPRKVIPNGTPFVPSREDKHRLKDLAIIEEN